MIPAGGLQSRAVSQAVCITADLAAEHLAAAAVRPHSSSSPRLELWQGSALGQGGISSRAHKAAHKAAQQHCRSSQPRVREARPACRQYWGGSLPCCCHDIRPGSGQAQVWPLELPSCGAAVLLELVLAALASCFSSMCSPEMNRSG